MSRQKCVGLFERLEEQLAAAEQSAPGLVPNLTEQEIADSIQRVGKVLESQTIGRSESR